VSHLVAAATEAASAALLALDELRRAVVRRSDGCVAAMSKDRNGSGDRDAAVEVVRKQDLETCFDELRRAVCRVDALADATVDAIVGAYGEQHKSLVDERVHQLASATAEAALDALEELDRARLAVER